MLKEYALSSLRERGSSSSPTTSSLLQSSAEQALAELLQSRPLRSHRLSRNCEIGPFILDYVFSEESLVVELQPAGGTPDRHCQARTAFLNGMGYRVVQVPPREVIAHPARVLARIQAALQ